SAAPNSAAARPASSKRYMDSALSGFVEETNHAPCSVAAATAGRQAKPPLPRCLAGPDGLRGNHPVSALFLGDPNGRPVTEDFGRVLPHFRGVVADADDGVRPALPGVFDHLVEGLLSGLLAHLGESADLAADDLLEAAEEPLGQGRGPDDDPPNQAQL